jgi:Na+-translocating ferredoxin:NAD+ oxidoreductase RnfG subunit
LLAGSGIVLVAPAPVRGAQVFLHENEAAHAMFPQATTSLRKELWLTDAEHTALEKALGRHVDSHGYTYLEVIAQKATVGFVLILDVIGQSQPITFAVAVSDEGILQDVQVMVYREPRGEEIQDKRFRRQFTGKRASDALALGKDIDAISGATISSRAATFAARKGLLLADLLRARMAAAKP